jgi:hypothetical protein
VSLIHLSTIFLRATTTVVEDQVEVLGAHRLRVVLATAFAVVVSTITYYLSTLVGQQMTRVECLPSISPGSASCVFTPFLTPYPPQYFLAGVLVGIVATVVVVYAPRLKKTQSQGVHSHPLSRPDAVSLRTNPSPVEPNDSPKESSEGSPG